jgi:hypothetical protein
MNRSHIVALLALAAAVPVAGSALFAPAPRPCLNTGNASYQLSSARDADTTVRIEDASAQPDLRVAFVDTADSADFILVDDGADAGSCPATGYRTLHISHSAAKADISVGIAADEPDYRIYLSSTLYSREDAAGLFAAMWRADHRRKVATR